MEMNRKPHTLLLLLLAALTHSCATHKNIAYFKDIPDSSRAIILNPRYHALIIHPDDMLNIRVQTVEANTAQVPTPAASFPGAAQGLSAEGAGGQMTSGLNTSSEFLVDKNGNVDLPELGRIKLAGLTTLDARDTILSKAGLLYKNPTVYVRFANLKITVLGEVTHPGTYVLQNEKNTILDALGLAGDLTIYGKRENALLIRDSSGYTTMTRFSLTSTDIIKQNYYYLQQNDVIYVEPSRAKIASLDASQARVYAIVASVLSILIVLASTSRL